MSQGSPAGRAIARARLDDLLAVAGPLVEEAKRNAELADAYRAIRAALTTDQELDAHEVAPAHAIIARVEALLDLRDAVAEHDDPELREIVHCIGERMVTAKIEHDPTEYREHSCALQEVSDILHRRLTMKPRPYAGDVTTVVSDARAVIDLLAKTEAAVPSPPPGWERHEPREGLAVWMADNEATVSIRRNGSTTIEADRRVSPRTLAEILACEAMFR